MTLREALALHSLQGTIVVAGATAMARVLRWVHVVDNPDPVSWVREGQLVLTTGYAWPRDARAQAQLVQEFADRGVTAVGLAVPQFFEHIPARMCAEADRLGLPLLEVPWEIPFAEITQEVHTELLQEHMNVIERSQAIHGALTAAAANARSLAQLAEELSNLVERSVGFLGMEGEVLAHGEPLGRPDRAEELWHHPSLPGAADDVATRLRRRRADQSTATTVHLSGALSSTRCAVAPVRLRGTLTAMVWLVEGDRPLDPLDERAAEHAAIVAALHLAHQSEVASMEMRFRRSFLDSLIEGRFESSPEALERARLLGFDPEARYRVGLVVLFEPVPLSLSAFSHREDIAGRLRRQLVDHGAPGLVTVSLNRVIMLIPEGVDPASVWAAVADEGVACVVSGPRNALDELPETFSQLLAVSPHLERSGLISLDALLLPRVLRGDVSAQQALRRKYVDPLGRARNGARLVETLLALPGEAFHLGRVSERLGIHVSTLRQRLERIEALDGVDLQDPTTRVELGVLSVLLQDS